MLKMLKKMPLLSSLVWPVAAQPDSICYRDAATQAYENEDYEIAANLLRSCVENGDAKASLQLATLYRTGKGVEANETEAAWWYKQAAEMGIPEAQFHLGLMYLEGIGVTENTEKAVYWLDKAADNDFGDAITLRNYILYADDVLDC